MYILVSTFYMYTCIFFHWNWILKHTVQFFITFLTLYKEMEIKINVSLYGKRMISINLLNCIFSLGLLSCYCHFDVPVFCGVHSNDHVCGAWPILLHHPLPALFVLVTRTDNNYLHHRLLAPRPGERSPQRLWTVGGGHLWLKDVHVLYHVELSLTVLNFHVLGGIRDSNRDNGVCIS